MEKALIYARVSTEEQAKDGRLSLETQQDLCEKAITDSDTYELAKNGIYIDAGKSATNMNRSGLQDLMIRVQEDKSIRAVFVLDTDRLARNTDDHTTIKTLLRKNGASVISVSQPGLDDTAEGNFMDIVIAGVNQFQSQITGRKTIKSMVQKFNNGVWPTRVPVGYLNVGAPDNPEKRIIVVDEVKGPLITELFKKYSTGSYSMLELADEFQKQGLISRTGGRLGIGNLLKLVRNPFFYGLMKWNGQEKMGSHTPLIDKDLYDRCQQVADDHNHHACRRRKYDFLLRGYVFSAVSGLRFIGETHPEKNKSYYRPYISNKNRPYKIPNEDKGINILDLETAVEEQFVGIQFSDEFIGKLLDRIQFIYDLKKRDVSREQKKILSTKAIAEQRLAVAEEKLVSGVLDDADFTSIKTRQREAISNCNEALLKLERGRNIKIDVIQKIIHLAKNLGEAYKAAPPELKRAYISLFWEKFEVANRKLVAAVPTPIVDGLIATGTICFNNKYKPIPLGKMFAQKNESFRHAVRIRNLRGDYRELNPD